MMRDEEIIEKVEETTKKAEQLQRETLSAILRRNASVRYLQAVGYEDDDDDDSIGGREDSFRRVVPLSSYDDYAEYMGKLADGDDEDGRPFLSFDPLLFFFYR